MVCNPLLHTEVEELVIECFVFGLLASQIIAETLAHLFANKSRVD